MTANRYEVPFRGDENMLGLDSRDRCTSINILKSSELYKKANSLYLNFKKRIHREEKRERSLNLVKGMLYPKA